MRPQLRFADRRAFTLVELLVVLVLAGVVGGITLNAVISGLHAARVGTERSAALADLQVGLERVSRDVRAARPLLVSSVGNYTTELGSVVYRDGGREEYEWRVTANADGSQDLVQDVRRYTSAGDEAPASTASQVFITRVTNTEDRPLFTYFDDEGEQIVCEDTSPACRGEYLSARTVVLTFRLDLEEHERPVVAETAVTVRNTQLH